GVNPRPGCPLGGWRRIHLRISFPEGWRPVSETAESPGGDTSSIRARPSAPGASEDAVHFHAIRIQPLPLDSHPVSTTKALEPVAQPAVRLVGKGHHHP